MLDFYTFEAVYVLGWCARLVQVFKFPYGGEVLVTDDLVGVLGKTLYFLQNSRLVRGIRRGVRLIEPGLV